MAPKFALIVFVGLPAAGKTSLVKELLRFSERRSPFPWLAGCKQISGSQSLISEIHCVHVCYDDIMTTKFTERIAEYKDDAWKTVRRRIRLCVEQEIRRLLGHVELSKHESGEKTAVHVASISDQPSSAMDLQDRLLEEDMQRQYERITRIHRVFGEEGDEIRLFFIDDNMFLRSMRYEYYQLARKHKIGFCQVYVRCSMEEAQRLNALREKSCITEEVTSSTIAKMATKLEAPDADNRWENFSLTVDNKNCCEDNHLCEVWQLILQSVYQPVDGSDEVDEDMRARDRVVCSQSVLHQTDQILRREISKQLKILQAQKSTKKEDLKKMAAFLNQRKNTLLEQMKTGNISFPDDLENCIMDAFKNENNPFYIFVRDIFIS